VGVATIAAAVTVLLLGVSAAQAAFPGRNGKIVFASDRPDALMYNIYTIRPDGTGLRKLADGEHGRDPAWSPDGRRIAFIRHSFAGVNDLVHVMDADGTNLRHVPNSGFARDPAWSPDGQHIVFTQVQEDGGSRIYSVKLDGSELTELARGREETDPAWSPDGAEIAFRSNRITTDIFSGYPQIYKMNADGTAQTRLTAAAAADESPNWSPDGSRIVFHSDRVPHDGGSKIFAIDADGSNVTRLTSGGSGRVDWWPAWSPDGTRIAYSTTRSQEGWRIWTMNPDGTGQALVTSPEGRFDLEPDWQPVPAGNRPPSCSGVAATPTELSPADSTLRLVTLSGGSDPDGDSVTPMVTGVTQDEPLTGGPDKSTPDAAPAQEPSAIQLRAERRNGRDGRVYRIAFTAEDTFGATCSGSTTVSVRSKPGRPAVDSAPPSFDSFGS
jgi:dipeptidyl aminopeptidase/acylaminoacyl peptidase